MRFKIIFLLSIILFITPVPVSAGDIDSPGPPSAGSGMYTIEDIYKYLIDGTEPTISSTFKEPTAGPGPTMKSTKDIYDETKAKFDSCDAAPEKVLEGVTFFGSSRISVKSMLRKYLKFKILKISIPKGPTNNISYRSVKSLHKSIGNSFNKIVEDFIPPIL